MKNVFHYFFLSATLLSAGCCFDPEGLDFGVEADHKSKSHCLRFDSTTALEIAWQKPLWQDTAEGEAIPVVFEDKVLLAFTGMDCCKLKMLDASDGHLLWQGEDPSNGEIARNAASLPRHGRHLVLTDCKKIMLLDLHTGLSSTLLEAPPKTSVQREMSILGDHLFFSLNACDDSLNYAILMRTNLSGEDGQMENLGDTLFVSAIKSHWSPHFSPPVFGTSLKGDTLLAFINYRYWFSELHLDLVICNLTRRKIMYEWADVEVNNGNNGRGEMISLENKIYLSTRNACRSFDMLTGKLLWERTTSNSCFPDGFAPIKAEWQVYNGARYAIGRQYKITAVDLETDALVWSEPTPNYTTCTIAGYPDDPPLFSGDVSINPQFGYIYASDGYFALCIKLPER